METAMRSTRLVAALLCATFRRRLILVLGLALLLSLTAAAQQTAGGKQRVPRLTTDDVIRPPVPQSVEESKESASTPGESGKAGQPVAKAAQSKAGEVVSADESSWRDRVAQARNRSKDAERAAEEAELRITALRNQLGTSGESARFRNEVAAELDETGKKLSELRVQARVASAELADLIEYGRQKGFTEAEGPKPTSEDGKPNEQYYRARLAKITGDLDSAQRQIALYENRLRDISQRILMNGGKKGGDNFYMAQLQQDRDDAQRKLDEARAALIKTQSDLENLIEEARRADVSRDLFR